MIPKPTLPEALSILRNSEEFKVFLEFLIDERESFIGQLRQAENTNDIMKLSGSISTLDELVQFIKVTEK